LTLDNNIHSINLIIGFSLNSYKTTNGISTLDDHHVSDILRKTGISKYMKKTPCVRSDPPYTGADGNNWKNGLFFYILHTL